MNYDFIHHFMQPIILICVSLVVFFDKIPNMVKIVNSNYHMHFVIKMVYKKYFLEQEVKGGCLKRLNSSTFLLPLLENV